MAGRRYKAAHESRCTMNRSRSSLFIHMQQQLWLCGFMESSVLNRTSFLFHHSPQEISRKFCFPHPDFRLCLQFDPHCSFLLSVNAYLSNSSTVDLPLKPPSPLTLSSLTHSLSISHLSPLLTSFVSICPSLSSTAHTLLSPFLWVCMALNQP